MVSFKHQKMPKPDDCCHRFEPISKLGLCVCYEELGERTKLDLGRQGKTNFRTVIENGEPWFVGKDVAEILGYSNTSKAVMNHVDEEDKRFLMLDIADSQNGNLPVGQSKTALVNEGGLYSLIIGSKLPNAGSLLEHTEWQQILDLLPFV